MANDASVTDCYYLSSIGVNKGIGTINNVVATQEQNDGAQPTERDINSYEEFLVWIENPNT